MPPAVVLMVVWVMTELQLLALLLGWLRLVKLMLLRLMLNEAKLPT
jgi:hypothetical protein